MTDPNRLPDPARAARTLLRGSAIIYRHFGAADAGSVAQTLRQITFARAQHLLIGDDPILAIKCGADGVHFRRDRALADIKLWRARCPDWIITKAGPKTALRDNKPAYSAGPSVLDAIFVSSIFPSESPSAGPPIGVAALSEICRDAALPVFALGGITARTAPQLIGSGAAGIAGISGIAP